MAKIRTDITPGQCECEREVITGRRSSSREWLPSFQNIDPIAGVYHIPKIGAVAAVVGVRMSAANSFAPD
jgi:hypothetical protein